MANQELELDRMVDVIRNYPSISSMKLVHLHKFSSSFMATFYMTANEVLVKL